MDVLIVPSLGSESFGLAVAEAQARGVPVRGVAPRRARRARPRRRATARSSIPTTRRRARGVVARLAARARDRGRLAAARCRRSKTMDAHALEIDAVYAAVRVRRERRRPSRAHGAARPARRGSARGARPRARPARRVARRARRAVAAAPGALGRADVLNVLAMPAAAGSAACRCSCATGCGTSRGAPQVLLAPDATASAWSTGRRLAARARLAGAAVGAGPCCEDRAFEDAVARGLARVGRARPPLRGCGRAAAGGARSALPRPPRASSSPCTTSRRSARARTCGRRPRRRFCDFSTDEARCHACLAQRLRRCRAASSGPGARAMADAARARGRVVFPSRGAAGRLARAAAGARPGAPARDRARRRAGRAVDPRAAGGAVRHAAFVGRGHRAKGALLLPGIARAVADVLRVSALGGGDAGGPAARSARSPASSVRGYYRAGTLPLLLRERAVDVALLLSLVPESTASRSTSAGARACRWSPSTTAPSRAGCAATAAGSWSRSRRGRSGVAAVLRALVSGARARARGARGATRCSTPAAAARPRTSRCTGRPA